MLEAVESILFTEEQVKARVRELGEQISRDYEGKNPVFVGILKGSFIFMADLVRTVTIDCTVDFMAVSSYGNSTSTTGAVKINKDLSEDIEGKHVILVEDILDSGITLNYLSKYLKNRNPASLAIVTLMDKPARRIAPVQPDYCGFEVPDEFLLGYGLDYAERFRNVPFIGILKREYYE